MFVICYKKDKTNPEGLLVILNFSNNQNVYDLLQKDRLQHECYVEIVCICC